MIFDWLSDNWIEIFGAVTGILYVFLEIRQNFWLWPVGIITSAVYIWVFFTSKFYADMSLQCYYLGISCLGWYWWARGREPRAGGREQGAGSRKQEPGSREQRAGSREQMAEGNEQGAESKGLRVTRLKLKTGMILTAAFAVIYLLLWLFLVRMTDSPVPRWDAFITSLSIVATWMLARKIYEHWFLWLVVNSVSIVLFVIKGLYPTVILYTIYFLMSFEGLREWKRSL